MAVFIEIALFFFNTGWTFLTSFNLPGVNFTPFAAICFSAFFTVVLKFIKNLIGRGGGGVISVDTVNKPTSSLPAVK